MTNYLEELKKVDGGRFVKALECKVAATCAAATLDQGLIEYMNSCGAMTQPYKVLEVHGWRNDGIAIGIATAAADRMSDAGVTVIGIKGICGHEPLAKDVPRVASVLFQNKGGGKSQADLRFFGDAPADGVATLADAAMKALAP